MNNVVKFPVNTTRIEIPNEVLSKMGDGGGNDMNLEARVAKLEAHIEHIQADISEIKDDLKNTNKKIDSNFRWLIGIFLVAFIGSFGGLATMMAHGFKWF